MTSARRVLAVLVVGVAALSQLSCDISDCNSLSPYSTVYVHSSGGPMWLGATHRLVATGYGVDCEDYIVSDQQPDSFTFVSDNPLVAPVTDEGVVTALAPGTTSTRTGAC